MYSKFKGILPALMTAFTESGIDSPKIAALTLKLIKEGVHGLYVGGSSGEMVLLTQTERMELLETVKANIGDRTLIAHIGAMSTNDSIILAKHAAKIKVDAISSVTPLYFKYSFAEIRHYYERLCYESGLPLIIYNIPAITGLTLDYGQLCELLNINGIAGMKFTSSDFYLLNRLKQTFPDKIFYNGSDDMLLSGLAAGADGGIGTTYNFMPSLILKIYNMFCENRINEAREEQSVVNRVIDVIRIYGVVPASKQMISYYGIDYGICREPFLPLDDNAKTVLYEKAWRCIN